MSSHKVCNALREKYIDFSPGRRRSLDEGDDGGDFRTGRGDHEGMWCTSILRSGRSDQQVSSDAEAIKLMNDTPFGLTASIWTSPDSLDTFDKLSDQIETGTVYLNGCDFVDANLAWAGVKDSGRGRALSKLGYDSFVRTKSISLKLSQE